MAVNVALGMKVLRLLASDHRQHFGHHGFEQAALAHQLQTARGAAAGHDRDDFLADALGGDIGDFGRGPAHRDPGRGVDFEIEPGGETHRAQHAEMVLLEALAGVADRPDHAGAQIAHPTDQVEDPAALRVEVHPADGEVAPARVLLDRAEAHRRGTAPINVRRIGAEGGDLERVAVDHHEDHAEARADADRVVEQFLHDLGARVGGDVVIVGRDAEHAVAHAAAGEVGDEALLAQALDYRQSLVFLFDVHNPGRGATGGRASFAVPMRFNLAARAARGHGGSRGPFQTNDDGGPAV